MSEQKHTPLPWNRPPAIDDETGEALPYPGLEIRGPEYVQPGYENHGYVSDVVCVLGFSGHHNHQANAEFITRACNSHYELLSALRDLVQADTEQSDVGLQILAIEKARAAIAKAEGREV